MRWLSRVIPSRDLQSGDRLPWWMGIAWRPVERDAVVAMPLGLHWLAGGLRSCYLWAQTSYAPDRLSTAYQGGYEAGVERGRTERAFQQAAIEHTIRMEAYRAGLQAGLEFRDDLQTLQTVNPARPMN